MHVVVNHLRLCEPVTAEVVGTLRDGVRSAVEAGALAARVVRADERHLILILEFAGAEDADRMARDVGGPGCGRTSGRSSPATQTAASAR